MSERADDGLERLVDSLLYEGYALYPYTPGATKNATPTPFGIVYPPAYAAGNAATFDRLEMQCLFESGSGAELSAEVRFLAPSGPRHEAAAQRVALAPVAVDELAAPRAQEFAFETDAGAPLRLAVSVTTEPADEGRLRATLRVENRTDAPAGLDRAGALQRSTISTHPILRLSAGRFISPLEAGSEGQSVNTWPVLATPGDDVMLGATIVLPDHPQIAPESRGNLFDGTEIEEALLLHVQTLSDDEREAIEAADPTVADMVARAAAATPEDVVRLHGRVTLRDPVTSEPPTPSEAVIDPSHGEEEVDADGVRFRRGDKVVLHPSPDADLHARLCDGRTATIERIFIEYDGKIHFGVTIDDDPGQDLLRETNRLLFFFPPEVEPLRQP